MAKKTILDLNEDVLREIVELDILSQDKVNSVPIINLVLQDQYRTVRHKYQHHGLLQAHPLLRRLYKEELAQLNVYEIHTSASELDNLTVSCYTWPNFPYEKVRYLRLVVNFSDGYFWRECKSGDTKAFKEKRTQALEQLKSLILKFKGVKDIELVFSRHTGSGERIRMDEDGFRFNLGREFRVLRDLNRYEITLAELEHVYGEPLLLERMKEFAMVHRGLLVTSELFN